MAAVVVKEFHAALLVHVVVHRVEVLVVFCHQLLVDVAALGFVGNEVFDHLAVVAHPAVAGAPLAVEVALNGAHVLLDGLLGIVLHACVDRRVNLQAVAVEVNVVVFAPVAHLLHHCHPEVGAVVVVLGLGGVLQVEVLGREAVKFLLCQVVVLQGIVEHGVAALKAALGMFQGVVDRGAFQDAHEHRALLGLEL